MSLLMEALRKAEQVKKKAAGVDGPPEPLDRETVPGQPLPPEPQPPMQKDEDTGIGLELTGQGPLKIERGDAESAPEETIDALDIWEIGEEVTDITLVADPLPPESIREENGESVSSPAVALAVEEPARTSDIPVSGLELQPAPDIPAAPEIPTVGASAEASRQTARAVFVAKNKHQRLARKRQFLLMAGLAGIIVLGVAGFLFFPHRTIMNSPPPITTFKKGPPPQAPPPAPNETPAADKPVASADTGGKLAGAGPGPSEQKSASGKTGDSLAETTQSPPETLAAEPRSKIVPVSSSLPVAASMSESLTRQDFPFASQRETKPALPPEQQAPSQPAIQIIHHASQPRSEPLMTAAYAAYQRGDFEQSRRSYKQILQADPEHRGALLGLAALALRLKETGPARDLYLRLLERDPSDPLARVGLMTVMPTGDPVRLESELKLLLDQHPNLAPLLFSLGNLYAAGKRWGEAQQAYFNALQAAGKATPQAEGVSPDYPYNLAVSLEHLNQSALAFKYYKEALRLAARQPAGFDKEALRHRLENFNQIETR